jgi:pimeloyl-ACP methyl ester carboxylesterase
MSKRIILVHGTGHSGWCRYKVAMLLGADGHRVDTPDLAVFDADPCPLRDASTFEDYSWPLLNALRGLTSGERAVLVGHSFGGMSIALAVEELLEKVAAAVFIPAFVPECAHPRTSAIEKLPALDWVDSITDDSHALPSVYLGPEFLRRKLYQLGPEEDYMMSETLAI